MLRASLPVPAPAHDLDCPDLHHCAKPWGGVVRSTTLPKRNRHLLPAQSENSNFSSLDPASTFWRSTLDPRLLSYQRRNAGGCDVRAHIAAVANDADARVGAAEYVVWRKGLATGAYTQADYNTWRANFRVTAAGA